MLGDTAEQDHRFEIPHAEMAEMLKIQQVQRQQWTACAGMSTSNDAKKRHHEEGTTDTAMEEFLGVQRKSHRNVEQVSCYIFNLSPNRNPEPSPNPNLNPDPNPTYY